MLANSARNMEVLECVMADCMRGCCVVVVNVEEEVS